MTRRPLTDTQLADKVLAAITKIPLGSPDRFGDQKVYISALHHHTRTATGLTLDQFKGRLVDLNRQQLITLARADYVSAMDPARVRASHTHHWGSDFHFVLDHRHD
jgi:hypothetical protein